MATVLAREPRRAPSTASPAASSAPPRAASHDWRGVDCLRESVLAFLVSRCRDEHEAEDLTHEALLRAARFRDRQCDPARLRPWLMQIAANLHRDHARKETRYAFTPHDEPLLADLEAAESAVRACEDVWFQVGERSLPGEEVLFALRRAFPGLPERDRVVLDAYYGDGGSTRSAAAAAVVEWSNVKVRLFRARRRLERRIRLQLADASADRLAAARRFLERGALVC